MRKRRFRKGAVHHIYQRTVNGYVINHTRRDYLVFLTLFFTIKEKYRVRILGVCPMVDHYHIVLEADTKEEMSAFNQEFTSKLVKEYNRSLGRTTGRLFPHRFGCAPKREEKDARSAIAYSYNNAPERHLCERAIEYQWNMLAYATSDHPFSKPIDPKQISPAMRKSMARVNAFHRSETALGYAVLGSLFKDLTREENLQLTDYILHTYCNVDFDRAISFYGSLEKMILAIDSNTGSEHDIQEEKVGYSDAVYAQMFKFIKKKTGVTDMKEILKMPISKRKELYRYLLTQEQFIKRQVEKYLQLPSNWKKK